MTWTKTIDRMGAAAVASIRAVRDTRSGARSRRLTQRRPILPPILLTDFKEAPAETIRVIAGGAFAVARLAR